MCLSVSTQKTELFQCLFQPSPIHTTEEMEKVIVFALLLVNVATCSSETAGACSSGYNACVMAAGTSSDQLCNCFGAYSICLLNNDCINATGFQNLVGDCEANGCTAQQCTGSILAPVDAPSYVSEPIASAPVTQPGCDATSCLNTYYACTNTSTEGFCPCYGDYLSCLYYVGCITESEYQNALQSCEQLGCSSQCSSSAPTTSTPVDAPSYAPTTSAPVTQPGCDTTTCINNYFACTNISTEGVCPCYGDYLACLYYVGCITQSEYQNATQSCEQYGCSTQQCTGGVLAPFDAPSYAPTTSTPVTQPGCDTTTCLNNYYACTDSSTEGYCPCYGEYLSCVYFMGCLNQSEYQTAIQSCEQLGCTAQQCLDQNAPTSNSPVSGTPVASPFNGPVSGCSAGQATLCANEYQSCVQEAGTDVNAICNCYGPYFMCLYDVGCLTVSQYQSLVQSCAQSGCTLQQCAWNNTVVAPTSSTPSSSSIPVSAPVSAPFAPPTAVICLQPWELVLIVVGSVLAGVGLAAIVGVIIYLSRRSSAKKTSTKYAKLQNY